MHPSSDPCAQDEDGSPATGAVKATTRVELSCGLVSHVASCGVTCANGVYERVDVLCDWSSTAPA